MNLHAVVSGAIGMINPPVPITIQRSTGYTISGDGTQVPSYAAPLTFFAQVQSLTADELRQIDSLNIQGEKRAVYIDGRSDGVIRQDRKGGDLITFNSELWLNVHVLEYWPDWCKFVITRQDGQ